MLEALKKIAWSITKGAAFMVALGLFAGVAASPAVLAHVTEDPRWLFGYTPILLLLLHTIGQDL